MKGFKKIVCSVLAAALIVSSFSGQIVEASTAEKYELSLPTLKEGALEGDCLEIAEAITGDMLADEAEDQGQQYCELEDGYVVSISELEAGYNWKKYSSNYLYKKLNKEEKKLYKKLDKVCSKLLNGTGNLKTINGYCTIGLVKTSLGLNRERLSKVIEFFTYSNPQYYFLSSGNMSNSKYCTILCYSQFSNGKTREKYTEKFREQLDSWVDSVKANASNGVERVRYIAQLLCDEITYDPSVLSGGGYSSSIYYDQSAASAVFDKVTVCAGYTKTFSMLASALGISNISITSLSHAWNGVKVEGKWYLVDVTYADQISYIMESFLLTSRSYLTDGAHDPVNRYSNVLPSFNDIYASTGNIGQSGVVIKNSGNLVSLSTPDRNQCILYTLDGSVPNEASSVYTGPFVVEPGTVVRAVSAAVYYSYTYDELYQIISVPNYSFSRLAYSKVYPVATPIVKKISSSNRKISFKWLKVSGANGYEVQYSTSKKFAKVKSKRASKKKGSLSIAKAKKGKTYYVRVRAYKNTETGKSYGKWSSAKKIKIK